MNFLRMECREFFMFDSRRDPRRNDCQVGVHSPAVIIKPKILALYVFPKQISLFFLIYDPDGNFYNYGKRGIHDKE